jgi:hypothetical protein
VSDSDVAGQAEVFDQLISLVDTFDPNAGVTAPTGCCTFTWMAGPGKTQDTTEYHCKKVLDGTWSPTPCGGRPPETGQLVSQDDDRKKLVAFLVQSEPEEQEQTIKTLVSSLNDANQSSESPYPLGACSFQLNGKTENLQTTEQVCKILQGQWQPSGSSSQS